MSESYRNKNSKVLSFLKKKGILILIGVLVLGISGSIIGYMVKVNSEKGPIKNSEKGFEGKIPVVDDDKTVNKPKKVVDVEPAKEGKLIYNRPVDCNISHDFSGSVPVFSESMNDWRLHQGVDYSTEEPLEVKACAEGIVEDVYYDGLMGQTVVIIHPDDTKTVYQSLAEDVKVIKGQTVKSRDIIGYTSDTAVSEGDRNAHLHFAVIKDGKYVDPKGLFE